MRANAINSIDNKQHKQNFGAVRLECSPEFNISVTDLLAGVHNRNIEKMCAARLYKTVINSFAIKNPDFEYSVGYDKVMHKVVGIIKIGKKMKAIINKDLAKALKKNAPNKLSEEDLIQLKKKKYLPLKKAMEESVENTFSSNRLQFLVKANIIPDAEAKRLESELEQAKYFSIKGKKLFDVLF